MPESILQLNPDKELLIIGFVYLALSFIVFPVYALLIYALHVRSDLRENISYKLINLINYCDVSQAFCHFLTGFFIIFPVLKYRIDVFVRIVGCTANTLWLATFVVMAILAFTRIGIAFFKTKPNKWSMWMKCALSLGSVYIVFVWITGCVTQNFQLTGPAWSYDMAIKYADIFAQLELVLCFPALLISFSSYVLIIFSIYRKKRQAQSTSSLRMEVGILIQATVLTAYMAILITLWHNAESWFKMTNITLASLNCVWIMFSHVNSILLIIINRSESPERMSHETVIYSGVRRQIVKFLCNKDLSRHTSRLGHLSRVSSTMPVGK